MSSLFYLTTCHVAGSHVGKMQVILNMEGHTDNYDDIAHG